MSDYLVNIGYKVDTSGLKEARKEIDNTNRSLKDTEQTGKKSGDATNKSFVAAGVPVANLATIATAAAAAIATIGATATMVARKVLDEFSKINDINDFALFSGEAAIKLAELEARATQVGVAFSTIEQVILRQQRAIDQGNPILERLGLNLDRLQVAGPARNFRDISIALDGVADSALRARAMNELFGRSGMDALKLYSGTVDDVHSTLSDVSGLMATQADLDRAGQLDEITNSIKGSTDQIKRDLARAFGPAVQSGAQVVADFLQRALGTAIKESEVLEAQFDTVNDQLKDIQDAASGGLIPQSDFERARELTDSLEERLELTKDIQREEEFLKRLLHEQAQLNRWFDRKEIAEIEEARARAVERKAKLEEKLKENDADIVAIRKELAEIEESILDAKADGLRKSREQNEEDEQGLTLAKERAKTVGGLFSGLDPVRIEAQLMVDDTFSGELDGALAILDGTEAAGKRVLDLLDQYDEKLRDATQRRELELTLAENNVETMEDLLQILDDQGVQYERTLDAARQITEQDPYTTLEDVEMVKELAQAVEDSSGNVLDFAANLLKLQEAMAKISQRRRDDAESGVRTDKFHRDINAEIMSIRERTALIESGQIRSQEELNRYVDTQRRIQDIINRAKADGVKLSREEAEVIAQTIIDEETRANIALRRTEDFDRFVARTIESVGDILGDAIIDGLETGKLSFRSFLDDIAKMLVQSGIRQLIASIFAPQQDGGSVFGSLISTMFTSMFGGGVTTGGGGSGGGGSGGGGTYGPGWEAQGGIFNTTSLAMIGEQSPEAVMPLKRNSRGQLGVMSDGNGGGKSTININNTINIGNADDPAKTAKLTQRALENMMDRKVKQMLINEQRSGNLLNGVQRGF